MEDSLRSGNLRVLSEKISKHLLIKQSESIMIYEICKVILDVYTVLLFDKPFSG